MRAHVVPLGQSGPTLDRSAKRALPASQRWTAKELRLVHAVHAVHAVQVPRRGEGEPEGPPPDPRPAPDERGGSGRTTTH